jgi:hypothetical protein
MIQYTTFKFFNSITLIFFLFLSIFYSSYAQQDCVFDGVYIKENKLKENSFVTNLITYKNGQSFKLKYKYSLDIAIDNRVCNTYGVKFSFNIDSVQKKNLTKIIDDMLNIFLIKKDYEIFNQNIGNTIQIFLEKSKLIKKTIELPTSIYDTYHIFLKKNNSKIEVEIEFYLS